MIWLTQKQKEVLYLIETNKKRITMREIWNRLNINHPQKVKNQINSLLLKWYIIKIWRWYSIVKWITNPDDINVNDMSLDELKRLKLIIDNNIKYRRRIE